MNKKIIEHILFWAILFTIYALSFNIDSKYYIYNLRNTSLKFPFYLIAAYTFNYWQVPQFLNKKKKITFVISFLITSFIIFIMFKWNVYLIDNTVETRLLNIPSYLTKSLMFYTPALIMYGYQTYQSQQKEKNRLLIIQQEKLDTELKYLKAQLNPHFLFNTLNNLYSFVMTNSPKAGDMILQLSEILDYVLYKSQVSFIEISEEIKCIENYINLEKIRYDERLEVVLEQPKQEISLQIAPLLLLSIVENAFKHSASNSVTATSIKVSIKQDNNNLLFNVRNTKNNNFNGAINDSYKKGIGLKNIKRQLNLLYPEKHILKINDGKDDFNINLQITI